jgi:hypothetical protein
MKYKHIVIPQFGGPENLILAEDELRVTPYNGVRIFSIHQIPELERS